MTEIPEHLKARAGKARERAEMDQKLIDEVRRTAPRHEPTSSWWKALMERASTPEARQDYAEKTTDALVETFTNHLYFKPGTPQAETRLPLMVRCYPADVEWVSALLAKVVTRADALLESRGVLVMPYDKDPS